MCAGDDAQSFPHISLSTWSKAYRNGDINFILQIRKLGLKGIEQFA